MPVRRAPVILVSYAAPLTHERWELGDGDPLPENNQHLDTVTLLRLILRAWIARTGRDALAGSNLAIRWDRRHPKVGVDPDVYLVEPAPPEGERVASLLLWKAGHASTRVAVEVVSPSNPEKDYEDAPARYAAAGVRELWIFDPALEGPSTGGGPHVLQLYRRGARDRFTRVHAGPCPAFSRELGAWLVTSSEGTRLRIADDRAGHKLWPTAEESELAARETERAEKEAALARVAELEAALARAAGPSKPRKRR